MIAAIVVIALAAGAAIVWYAVLARRTPVATSPPPGASWTGAVGAEFAELSESGRCELIFALEALDDPASLALLAGALDDPSETVALAAAHALASRGDGVRLRDYFAGHPGRRAARIAHTLALLDGGVTPSS